MHLLDKFKYCPVCGSKNFNISGIRSKCCDNCGFTFYLNASASTAAFIINNKDELLVVRRTFEPAKGTLDLPGGFVDPGESITDGMLREIKDGTQFVGSHRGTYARVCLACIRAELGSCRDSPRMFPLLSGAEGKGCSV